MNKTTRLAMLLLLVALPARAQWTIDGVGVCTAIGLQGIQAITNDNAGGWITAWADTRGASQDIYAQRLDAAGTPLWTANGVVVCNAANTQTNLRIASDGAGGAIVIWSDRRGSSWDVYAQRIDPTGTAVWTANGVPICTAVNNQFYPQLSPDGAGGAIITWTDYRNGSNTAIYAQRVNAAGVVQWAVDGAPVSTLATLAYMPAIVTDGAGGAIITWNDTRNGSTNSDIFAQRMNAAGVPLWTANGVNVCTVASDQLYPWMVADGSNGAVIAWLDERGADDIYAQRINSGGAIQWPAAGVPIRTGFGFQTDDSTPGMIPDGSGGIIIAWSDWRTGINNDVYAQRVNGLGAVQWTLNGVGVCTALNDQLSPVIAPDASGGAIISWWDARIVDSNIYAQRLSAAGAPQWTPNGVALCSAPGNQSYPAMLADGSGGAVVAWEDERAGNRDIYAQRMGAGGLPYSFTVTKTDDDNTSGTLRTAITQANTTPGLQTIRFNIPGGGVQTIQPSSDFPIVTDALTIDGFTQPGAYPNTTPVGAPSDAQIVIEIDGSQFGSPRGFQFSASDCTLRGVSMFGIYIPVSVSAPNAVIEGNYLGFRADGQPFPSNPGDGVIVMGSNCRVGGASAAARNVIGGLRSGVYVYGVSGPQIYGNYIGISPDLVTAQQNSIGVWLINTSGARIGSSVLTLTPNSQEANIIANDLNGVGMEGTGTVNNMVVGNSFFGTYYSAIDLGLDGPTYNDRNDADTGPNNKQNQPVITAVSASQIDGFKEGIPGQSVEIHFYRSSSCGGSDGRGNAITYIGGVALTLFNFSFHPAQPIPPGSFITCTETDLAGNTSELTGCVQYQNTGSGSNVTVNLVDAGGTAYGTATYQNVTGTGNTYIANPYTPPVPVSGYAIGNPSDPQIYFNITTDASYTGGVDVCLNYDETHIPGPEANLVLLHYDGTMWANVTTSRDLVNNRICGHVTSLSPFVIGAVSTTGVGDTPLPTQFALHANVPNPFNPITTISYDIPSGGADVNISVFDISGRLVRELLHEHRLAGVSSVRWNGEDDRGARVASGVYFYRMRAGDFVETKKMVLLK